MIRGFGLILIVMSFLYSLEIPIKEVKREIFWDTLKVNSKIIQLTDAKQSIMSRVEGKVTRYLVNIGDMVKKGQGVATIESIELSKLYSELSLLKKQLKPIEKNYLMTKKLYKTGMTSLQEYNRESIRYSEIKSKIDSINANLSLMGVEDNNGSNSYTLYAYSSGVVTDIYKPLNAIVGRGDELISIANEKSIYLKSFLPLRYAKDIEVGQRLTLNYAGEVINLEVSQILHKLDRVTQQVVVLSAIKESKSHLFIDSFVESTFYIGSPKKYLTIEKSAISFYEDEWVVFVPKEEEHHEEEEHKDEFEYDIKVIKPIKTNQNLVAIEGLKEGDRYVSDSVYYIKSLFLKSSMGGHGH
jgi:multidrug efflux pump subunit AcrA (membrane-fusion protein)